MTETINTGTTVTIGVPSLTKNQIIQRLYDNKQITFEEMTALLEKETIYVPSYPDNPIGPIWINTPCRPFYTDPSYPWTITF